jgi:hypothetical protein
VANNRQTFIDPDRLMNAVDATLAAAADVAAYTGGPIIYPADLMGTPMQPECLADFTKWEIEQACEFLTRCGFLTFEDADDLTQ